MNKNGFYRNCKLVLHNFALSSSQILLMLPAMYLYTILLNKLLDAAALSTDVMIIAYVLLMPLVTPISNISMIYKYTVGFSSTKKNFFAASLINKLLYSILSVLTAFIASAATGFDLLLTSGNLFIVFIMTLALSSFGEIFGILIFKSFKTGYIAYMLVFCGLTFGVIGIYIYYTIVYPEVSFMDMIYSNLSVPLYCVVSIILFAVFSVINWFMIKSVEIRS